MSDMTVALDAMRSDAGLWETAANDLMGPINAIPSLGLTPSDVSSFGIDAGIDRVYSEAQSALESILIQGAANFQKLGKALRAAATMYEQQEEHATSQVKAAGEIN
jgi:hypothetical protein